MPSPCEILFIHQNMPGQFRHLAATFARTPEFRVTFLTRREGVAMPGITVARYPSPATERETSDPLLAPVEMAVRFGRAVLKAALALRNQGYNPHLIVAHPGWGEGLFLRDVWPAARIISYGEYYYRADGGDIGFDPLFPPTSQGLARARLMNTHLLLAHEQADRVLSPTHWQRDRHPLLLRDRISVIFDGVDTVRLDPATRQTAPFTTPDGTVLSPDDEVITYVARNLEPHRGFHVLMRALPRLLAERPKAHVVIVGGEEVSYSPKPPAPHASWKDMLLAEVDLGQAQSRVHFVGKLAYQHYLDLLAASSVHLYLTYPFVLSWSCVEAMAAGCLIVASDTGPVREVIEHGEQGLLFPFFDGEALVASVCAALDDPDRSTTMRKAARKRAVERYDLRSCLAAQARLFEQVLRN